MNEVQLAGAFLAAGSVVFLAGATIGVPRVFTEPDAARRLKLLEASATAWRLAQPLYALGPLVAAAGVGVLAARLRGPAAASGMLVAAATAMFLGAIPWAVLALRRGRHVEDFVYGRLPAWPFVTYVLATIAGIALLAIALGLQRYPSWIAWLMLALDACYLALYIWRRDLPPFLFYLLLLVPGADLMLAPL